jgi:hypothetical protein
MDRTENIVPNNSSIVARVFVATEMFAGPLPSSGRLFWLHYSGLQASCHNMNIPKCIANVEGCIVYFYNFTSCDL